MLKQFALRVLFLLADVGVNYYILSTHQPFMIGADYGQSIVLFNAAMIVIICSVDFITVEIGGRARKFRSTYEMGRGLTDLYRHEH